jgi:hypothetical protein
LRGVAIFAKACFGHPSPSKRQKLNATANAFGAPDVLRTCHFATTDLQQGDYRLSKRFKIEGVSRKPAGLRQFLEADNPLSRYVWRVWSTTFIYAAELIPALPAMESEREGW